jgi:hypothetical protein
MERDGLCQGEHPNLALQFLALPHVILVQERDERGRRRAARDAISGRRCAVPRRRACAELTEISYYYEAWVVEACCGHWELRGSPSRGKLHWVEGQVAPEDAILEDFLAVIARGQPPRQ